MNAPAIKPPLRRGACPGLSSPMPTGDGLLVRLLPIGTIPVAAVAELCKAARRHGNGIIEVTARGSIQVRGLRPASAPRFAAVIAQLGITAAEGIAVHTSPLCGLDPDEILNAEKLATALRRALAEHALAARLAPKISVVIDGGGALGLDALSADVRLRAELKRGQAVFAVNMGGDSAGATPIGFVAPENTVSAATRLLEVIARHGRDARARDMIDNEGIEPFRRPIHDLLLTPGGGHPELDSRLRVNERTSVFGAHRLRDGSFACGVGLAFGHADASSLAQLAKAAAAAGAHGLRTAPGRVVLAIRVAPGALQAFAAEAERLGFIASADDPRRVVVACAGAPICASAHIATRAMAPSIAAMVAPHRKGPHTVHLSGCAKGCAHPAAATLTIVGTPAGCALIADGSARDDPRAIVPAAELPAAIAGLTQPAQRGDSHD